MRTFRRQIQPPPLITGYRIDDIHQFAVVIPVERTNLVTNPSLETNTTGYTAVGGSIARSTTQQRHGAYSLAVTPTSGAGDGVYYGTVSLTSGTTYAYSLDIYATAGVPYTLYVATTGGVQVGGAKQFRGTGRWRRVWLLYTETSTTTRRLYLTKDASTSTDVLYLDGVQLEACAAGEAWPTTYIDGDQLGLIPNQSPPAYYWQGTPHASTSARSGQTRAGGRLLSLARSGFTLLAITGLGLTTPEVAITEYAQLDSGQYQRTRKPTRTFQIGGRFDARTPIHLDRLRGNLARVLDRDAAGDDQRMVLRYQAMTCDTPIGEELTIACVYAGGLEGAVTGHTGELATIAFMTTRAALLTAGDDGATLTVQASLASNNRAIQRSPTGVWSNLSTGLNGLVDAMVTGKDGRIYYGGTFTTPGTRVAYWDPVAQTWNTMSTGLDAQVRALAVAPNGDIIAGGSFTGKVSRWNGSAWVTVGTVPGTTPIIYDVAVDQTGNIYAVGTDTGTNRPLAAVWNGSAWTSLTAAGSATAIITCAVISRDNQLYVGGDFLTLDGTTLNRVARYSGTPNSWVALGSGMNSSVTDTDIGPDNRLYAVGLFTTAGGNAALYAAVWNGTSWTNLGNGESGTASSIVVSSQTNEIIVGSATGAWQYTGAAFVALDLSISASNLYMAFGNDRTLYLGYDTAGTVTTGATTSVVNGGTAHAYPVVRLNGPSSGTADIQRIVNYTTGRAIYLDYTMNAGEIATLIFTPDQLSFLSDFQSSIASRILAGSHDGDFFLAKGTNAIGVYATSSTITAVMYWTPAYVHLSDAIYE